MIKTSLLTIFLLFNSSTTQGIKRIEKLAQVEKPANKGLIDIDIEEIAYAPERVAETPKLSDDFNTQLEEAFDKPGHKGRYQ